MGSHEDATLSEVQAVFSTFELLESILSLLSFEEVFKATQVCRFWQDVISESSTLQQLFYLQPAEPTLMAHQFFTRCDCEPSRRTQRTLRFIGDTGHTILARLHPHISVTTEPSWPTDTIDDFEKQVSRLGRRNPWQNTFLTQPPCTKVSIHKSCRCRRSDWADRVFHSPEGIQLGWLALQLENWLEGHPGLYLKGRPVTVSLRDTVVLSFSSYEAAVAETF